MQDIAAHLKPDSENKVLNLLKGLACIGVVFTHIRFPGTVGDIVWKLSQFAVPVFLMVSVFFAFGKDEIVIKRRLLKILGILIWGYACFFAYESFLHILSGSYKEWIIQNYSWETPVNYIVFCTIDFAILLWYLIAMVETYFVWFFIVKYKQEQKTFWAIPLLFGLRIILLIYCERMELPWMYKVNFLTGAAPYFLLGYFIRSKKSFFTSIRSTLLVVLVILGGGMSVAPMFFGTIPDLSCIGLVIYSASIFILATKVPNKSYWNHMEYIGKKLSLNVYIFHVIIFGILNLAGKHLLHTNLRAGLCGWILPILVAILTVVFAQSLEMLKVYRKK